MIRHWRRTPVGKLVVAAESRNKERKEHDGGWKVVR